MLWGGSGLVSLRGTINHLPAMGAKRATVCGCSADEVLEIHLDGPGYDQIATLIRIIAQSRRALLVDSNALMDEEQMVQVTDEEFCVCICGHTALQVQ